MTKRYEAIFARKCSLRDISHRKYASLVREFLETNHAQGWARGNRVVLGLFHNDELVQIMTFGKPRFNRHFEWEIIRECSKANTQIIGGASKLFKHFVKENKPLSVIVYTSAKHDHLFENKNHYIKHMDFSEFEKSKKVKEGVFVSKEWPRKDSYGQSYSASAINRIGPDRLLGTKFGFTNGSNQDIMFALGYELQKIDSVSSKSDIWISEKTVNNSTDASGYLYKVNCSCGAIYFGMSERTKPAEIENYMGSGSKWLSHLKTNPTHTQNKVILKWFKDTDELRTEETNIVYIGKKIYGTLSFNLKETKQGVVCAECGSFGRHKKQCSKYYTPGSRTAPCLECGGLSNHHRITCSLYVVPRKPETCLECGGERGHRKNCSKKISCVECGSGNLGAHRTTCSLYTPPTACAECGNMKHHSPSCSLFTEKKACAECNSKSRHKFTCSQYKDASKCSECGGTFNHLASCSKQKRKRCSECNSLTKHKSTCPLYVEPKKCAECGAIAIHFKKCSKYRILTKCSECGSPGGSHKKPCSRYVDRKCAECEGYPGGHRKTCSLYKERTACVECGSKARHKNTCSKKRKRANPPIFSS